jgi:hypothetical protein
MKRALTLATGFAAGYVAGTRAGREKYEQMKLKVQEVSQQPAVADMRENLQERVGTASKVVAEKVTDVTSGLTKKLHSSSDDQDASTPVTPAPAKTSDFPAAPTGVVPGSGTL